MRLYIQENRTQGQTLSELCQKLLNCTGQKYGFVFNGLPHIMYTVAI